MFTNEQLGITFVLFRFIYLPLFILMSNCSFRSMIIIIIEKKSVLLLVSWCFLVYLLSKSSRYNFFLAIFSWFFFVLMLFFLPSGSRLTLFFALHMPCLFSLMFSLLSTLYLHLVLNSTLPLFPCFFNPPISYLF